MTQPVPKVSESDVVRVVQREFPSAQFETVMSVLNEYGTEDWHHEGCRVRLAVLKLATGNLEVLRRKTEVAKCDYRDILAYAEYPEYMKKVSPDSDLPKKQVRAVVARDWSQYEKWLNKEVGEQ